MGTFNICSVERFLGHFAVVHPVLINASIIITLTEIQFDLVVSINSEERPRKNGFEWTRCNFPGIFPVSGSKYLSPKLNEIGKSEHKSSDAAGKGTHEDWPQRDSDTCEYTVQCDRYTARSFPSARIRFLSETSNFRSRG